MQVSPCCVHVGELGAVDQKRREHAAMCSFRFRSIESLFGRKVTVCSEVIGSTVWVFSKLSLLDNGFTIRFLIH